MNPPHAEIASQLITLLAAGMLVIQLLMVVQGMLLTNIRLFALQSLMLAAIAAIIAYFHNATHVYWVAGLTLVGKVFFLPWLLNRLVRRIQIHQEIEPLLNWTASMLLCGAFTLLGYIVARPFTSLERLGNDTLAIAITLLLTGFLLMWNRRDAGGGRPDALRHAAGRRAGHFLRRDGGRDGAGHFGLPHPRDLLLDG